MGSLAAVSAAVSLSPLLYSCKDSCEGCPDSNFKGVQIGAITYSWRSMPGSAEDILSYCIQSGISSVELMGNVVEDYAGIPQGVPRLKRGIEISDEEREKHEQSVIEANEKRLQWRLNPPVEKFKELRKMYNDAGVNIHIVKFSPARSSDEEIDYAFETAKIMGAGGVSNEIGEEACKRLGKFAEKHDMYAVYHNHTQPGEPGFSFDKFLAYSPNNMLNFDIGHYIGATGNHPNKVIERLHDRIYSLHLKDKTSKNTTPPNTNKPWGEGDTPLADILNLIKEKKWPIYCDIELEYEVPENSDAVKETTKCVEYCKNILM
jgi:sugar phosphate isomerase/epimerase